MNCISQPNSTSYSITVPKRKIKLLQLQTTKQLTINYFLRQKKEKRGYPLG
jgi:hypothetical protein